MFGKPLGLILASIGQPGQVEQSLPKVLPGFEAEMSTIGTGLCPVSILYICLVSAADICPVSTADICPVSTADICPVSTEDIRPLWRHLGGTKMISIPFLHLKCAKWNTADT